MDSIFFEKQVALLCAQHALNMLLQDDYFSADTLAEIAHKLDAEENSVLDASSRNKESQNMNDAGFFSVQVIAEALKSFQLELVPINHPSVADIKKDPLKAKAFICNRSEHWFTLRKFGKQWFELNSCKTGPELHTDTYISLFLSQLANEGYTILVVRGILPNCLADKVIAENPVLFVPRPAKTKKEEEKPKEVFVGKGQRLGGEAGNEDDEMAEAIRLSLMENDTSEEEVKKALKASTEGEEEERSLQEALLMSMQNTIDPVKVSANEDAKTKREAFLKRLG